MATTADAYFAIGRTHKVCQDYALAGTFGTDKRFALVCDGCSSSPDTDFGARLLARAAAHNLATFGDQFDPKLAIWLAEGHRQGIGLQSHALDATLLTVFELDNGLARVFVVGDGVVAARRRDTGKYDYWAIRYPSGAPGYLTYLLDPGRQDIYLEQTGGKRTVEVVWGSGAPGVKAEESWETHGPVWTLDRDPAIYDIIAVMSDGAESFQRPVGTRLESIPLPEMLDQVMAVQGLTGEFLTRRVNRFLTKFCVKEGWQHYDDFGIAALAFDLEETP
jgi:hypothetical protein